MIFMWRDHFVFLFFVSFFVSPLFTSYVLGMDDESYWGHKTRNNNLLHIAAERGEDQNLRQLLGQGWVSKIGTMNNEGYTPLHVAVRRNATSSGLLLLQAGANVNQTITRNGTRTALDLCLDQKQVNLDLFKILLQAGAIIGDRWEDLIRAGNANVISLILEHGRGIDLNSRSSRGRPPLHNAIAGLSNSIASFLYHKGTRPDYKVIIELLLKGGADPNLPDMFGGKTPCHLVVERSDAKENEVEYVLNLLFKHGANADVVDKDLSTPLHIASSKGSIKVLEMLLKRSKNANLKDKESRTPLHLAVGSKSLEKTQLLLQNGADVTVVDKDLSTPLHLASQEDSPSIVSLLLSGRANPNATDQDKRLPLHLAAYSLKEENIERLLPNTHDVNKIDKGGSTPLHLMLRASPSTERWMDEQDTASLLEKRLIQLVKSFISKGADLRIFNKEGDSCLHLALARGYRNIAALFLDCGIEVNVSNKKGETPLFLAVSKEINHPIVERLLKLGADPNQSDENGYGPFYMAWKKRYGPIVKLLLEYNAQPNIRFRKETPSSIRITTPLEEAAESRNIEGVICLLKHGAKVPKGLICTLIKTLGREKPKEEDIFHTLSFNRNDKSTPKSSGLKGRRALSLKPKKIDLEIIALLLKHGGDPNAPDALGKFPLKEIFLKDLEFYNPVIQMLHQEGAHQYFFEDKKVQVLDLKKLALKTLIQASKSSPETLKEFYEVLDPLSPIIKETYFKEFLPAETGKRSLEDKLSGWIHEIDAQEKAEIERKKREEREKYQKRYYENEENEDRYTNIWGQDWTDEDEERWLDGVKDYD